MEELELYSGLLFWGGIILFGYYILVNLVYLTLICASFLRIRKLRKEQIAYDMEGMFKTDLYKSVSILVPCYNEADTIIDSISSLLQLEFHDYEIIIINDGSTDQTLDLLKKEYDLKPVNLYMDDRFETEEVKQVYATGRFKNLILIDKKNGQKADALNAGLNMAHKDLICAIDADSRLERDVLKKMLQAFLENENTIAVGGIIRVKNGCTFEYDHIQQVRMPSSFVPGIQVLEYLRAFLYGRIGWDYFDSLIMVSGAFGVFDREALMKVGGYDNDSIGEDFELTGKLHRHFIEQDIDYTISFIPDPVCWTQVPETWRELSQQRNRWYRGLIGSLYKHRKMLLNPRYKSVGFLSMPYQYFVEFLGPIIEFFGYIMLIYLFISGQLNTSFAILYFVVAVLFGMILSIFGMITDELTHRQYPKTNDALSLIAYAFVENMGYRQLHTWWRIHGLFDLLRGSAHWAKSDYKWISPRIINIMHWVWLILINVFILLLAWFGLTGGA